MATTRELRCDLDEAQLKIKAEALAQATTDRRNKKQTAKNTASTAAAEIKEIDERILQLTRDYQDRSETRSVDVQEVHDKKTGEVRIVRLDTKEVIDSRKMTGEEKEGHNLSPDAKQAPPN